MKRKLKTFFFDHSLLHYAASLSFHTILALIPILIISFFIFSHLSIFSIFLESVKEFIFSLVMPTNQKEIINHVEEFLQSSDNLGYIGFVFVLYVSIMFFDDFEYVVNRIFKTAPRKFLHSISLYLLISILAPIGLGISLYLSMKATFFIHDITYISSYLIVWLIFFILYKISANTKVYFKNAFISSFIASLVWFLSKALFVYYITYNETYLNIYGSFSIIMFFLLWIYLSWIIFLYGIKLCYVLNKS